MEKAVTLYIQGHGSENIKVPFDNNGNVKLLSFVGIPGKSGLMDICDYYNKQPIDKVVIYFLQKNIEEKFHNQSSLNNQEQSKFLSDSKDYIKKIYENCDINYENGFTETYPISERYFFFQPGPDDHENCRLCSNKACFDEKVKRLELTNQICPKRCLEERNLNKLFCPEYGLFVVSSSFPADERFTLAGNSFKERLNANINMKLSNKTYWKNRASKEYKYLVDKIYNEKEITLTELSLLFYSMGFEYIYLLDPTCRDCEIQEYEVEEYKKTETIRPTERINNKQQKIVTIQPSNSIIPETSNIKQKPSSIPTLNDCYKGFCNMFPKSKVNGGKQRKKTSKKFLKKRKNDKIRNYTTRKLTKQKN
jgi:hypothetical protein